MNKYFSALALAAGLVASTSAGASTYDLGSLSEGVTLIAPYSVSYTPPGFDALQGFFYDTLSFSISQEQTVTVGATALNYSLNGTPYKDITGMYIGLLDKNDYVVIGSAVGFTAWWLPAGNYKIEIMGVADGSAGGEAGGAIQISSVPESGSSAMLLAGLGLLGFALLRRKA